ncbi:hypothetical protein TrLO_g6724 [Triparma laevis f. longispina]|uniref:Nephrocystin 3-like N-terminal domain-containing protein n=1 Tax=Triparma laevis f. longispina TaxID=1714387 RepID=A0A9W7FNW7_9STRA|nr:hypothetical protein TrLO_g6724 [Triparma laevis f. longispina]
MRIRVAYEGGEESWCQLNDFELVHEKADENISEALFAKVDADSSNPNPGNSSTAQADEANQKVCPSLQQEEQNEVQNDSPASPIVEVAGMRLRECDFSGMLAEKQGQHMQGTREWLLESIRRWSEHKQDDSKRLLWVMGGAGTGKSVVSAVAISRLGGSVVAWHFARHDNPSANEPTVLLRSVCAMCCRRLPGFRAVLGQEEEGALAKAMTSAKPDQVFATLIEAPLCSLDAADRAAGRTRAPVVLVLDALDEVAHGGLLAMLSLLKQDFERLPPWVRVPVTSREQACILDCVTAIGPGVVETVGLRVGEQRNLQDVQAYLREIARTTGFTQYRLSDLECEASRHFGVDLTGALEPIGQAVDKSRETYATALQAAREVDEAGFVGVMELTGIRDATLRQPADNIESLYSLSGMAREVMRGALAKEWVLDKNISTPVDGTAVEWVEEAVDPGLKGKESALRKIRDKYDGDASQMKDICRVSLIYTGLGGIHRGLKGLQALEGWVMVSCKNKYASPTPLGYADINCLFSVPVKDKPPVLCEVQLHMQSVLDAKTLAHEQYEFIRSELPRLCRDTSADAQSLQDFIFKRLDASQLDAAVMAMNKKAQGLFIYCRMLADSLQQKKREREGSLSFADLEELPAGLHSMFEENFQRVFPSSQANWWAASHSMICLAVGAMEPLPIELMVEVLKWDDATRARVCELTSLLFPVRKGRVRVLHKSVVDWLTAPGRADQTHTVSAADIASAHLNLASSGLTALEGLLAQPSKKNPSPSQAYALSHTITHACEAGSAHRLELQARLQPLLDRLGFVAAKLDAGLLQSLLANYKMAAQYFGGETIVATLRFLRSHVGILAGEPTALYQLASQRDQDLSSPSSVGRDKRIRVWDLEDGEEDISIAYEPGEAKHKGFNSDWLLRPLAYSGEEEERLAVGTSNGQVLVFDPVTGSKLQQIAVTPGWALGQLMFSKDGALLLASSDDGTARLIDMVTNEQKVAFTDGHMGGVVSAALSPDGKRVSTGCTYGRLVLWDAWSNAGHALAYGTDDSRTFIKETATGKTTCLGRTTAWVWQAVWSQDDELLATCSSDRKLAVWQLDSKKLFLVPGHAHRVAAVAFAGAGSERIVTGSMDKTVKVWDTASIVSGNILPPPAGQNYRVLVTLRGILHPVQGQVVTAQGFHSWVEISSLVGTDDTTGEPMRQLCGKVQHPGCVIKALNLAPPTGGQGGVRIVTMCIGNQVFDWSSMGHVIISSSAGQPLWVHTASQHQSSVGVPPSDVAARSASRTLAVMFRNGVVCLYHSDNYALLCTFSHAQPEVGHQQTRFVEARAVAFSPDGAGIVTAYHNSVRMWRRAPDGKRVTEEGPLGFVADCGGVMELHFATVTAVPGMAFDCDLVVGGATGLDVWRPLREGDGTMAGFQHSMRVAPRIAHGCSMNFSPSGQLLMVVDNLSLRVFHVRSWDLKHVYYGSFVCGDFLDENKHLGGTADGRIMSLSAIRPKPVVFLP